MALAYSIVDHIPYTINGKVDFKKLEKLNFEDIEFIIVDDPIFDQYFIHDEEIEKVKLNNIKVLKKKLK